MFHTTPAVLIALNSPRHAADAGHAGGVPQRAADLARLSDATLPAAMARDADRSQRRCQRSRKAAKIVVDKSDQVLRGARRRRQARRAVPGDDGQHARSAADRALEDQRRPTTTRRSTIIPSCSGMRKASDKKAMLPPGPNGPVGWCGSTCPSRITASTARPSRRRSAATESHGCIRLTNWDAARLSLMVKPGTPAIFQE